MSNDEHFDKFIKHYNFNDYFFDIDNNFKLNINYLNFLIYYYYNTRVNHYVNARINHDRESFYKHYSDEFIDNYNSTLCYESNDDDRIINVRGS